MVPENWLTCLHLKKGMKDTFCDEVKIQMSVDVSGEKREDDLLCGRKWVCLGRRSGSCS